jgi:hypothetical protein
MLPESMLMIQNLIVDNVKSVARATSGENVTGFKNVFLEHKATAKETTLFMTSHITITRINKIERNTRLN